ncbi:MAG: GSU2403 family nucleotidyltransferase fold protein [Elusimicrobiota bacterium]
MNPTGEIDPLYILARRVLLDALEALGRQRDAIILAGAQAVYLNTGSAGLAVPEYTTDADIAFNPELLSEKPHLEDVLQKAGFRSDPAHIGTWLARKTFENREIDVMLDLLVPEAVGGAGRRGARLGPHGNRAARKVKGLEASLMDNHKMLIPAFERADGRSYEIAVAGTVALLIAKLHKIADREGEINRLQDKDALDVLRLLRSLEANSSAKVFHKAMADKIAGNVSREAVVLLEQLFGKPDSAGSRMAARAAEPLEAADTIAASCAVLTQDLLKALRG